MASPLDRDTEPPAETSHTLESAAAPPTDPIATTTATAASPTTTSEPESESDLTSVAMADHASSHTDTSAAVAVAAAAAAAAAVVEARASAEAEASESGRPAKRPRSPSAAAAAAGSENSALDSGSVDDTASLEDGDMSPRKLARLESGSRFDDHTATTSDATYEHQQHDHLAAETALSVLRGAEALMSQHSAAAAAAAAEAAETTEATPTTSTENDADAAAAVAAAAAAAVAAAEAVSSSAAAASVPATAPPADMVAHTEHMDLDPEIIREAQEQQQQQHLQQQQHQSQPQPEQQHQQRHQHQPPPQLPSLVPATSYSSTGTTGTSSGDPTSADLAAAQPTHRPMPELAPRSPSSKRHKCPYCDTEFTRHHNLKSHLLTHSQEKPYICQGCDMRFRRLHDLKRHSKLHTGEKPHICPHCDRKFARGDALARHSKGAGGCAGRRSSSGAFGNLSNMGNTSMDDSGFEGNSSMMEGDSVMSGIEYEGASSSSANADGASGLTEEEQRRMSLPGTKTHHARGRAPTSVGVPHARTYPSLSQHQGRLQPPNVDRSAAANSASATSGTSVTTPGGGSIFSHHGIIAESPKTMSPATQTHQAHDPKMINGDVSGPASTASTAAAAVAAAAAAAAATSSPEQNVWTYIESLLEQIKTQDERIKEQDERVAQLQAANHEYESQIANLSAELGRQLQHQVQQHFEQQQQQQQHELHEVQAEHHQDPAEQQYAPHEQHDHQHEDHFSAKTEAPVPVGAHTADGVETQAGESAEHSEQGIEQQLARQVAQALNASAGQ